MPKLSEEFRETVGKLAAHWASVAAVGGFAVYVLGYLIVRFHLTAFGIGTDLAVVDERYLFAGAKFLVYLFSTIPVLVFLAVLLTLLAVAAYAAAYAASWALSKVLPRRVGVKAGLVRRAWRRALFVWSRPRSVVSGVGADALAFAGVALSVAVIQFAMRQSFEFNDLLLSPRPPRHWLTPILLDETGASQYYYFNALVIATLLSLGLLLAVWRRRARRRTSFLVLLLSLLVFVQFLFLPINYGILVFDKVVPRVTTLGGQQELPKCGGGCPEGCQEAWLVWEGSEGKTYLVRGWGAQGGRSLVTLPLEDDKRTEIVGYDPILNTLLLNKGCL